MINKSSALMFLKQPFRYANGTLYGGVKLSQKAGDSDYTPCSYYGDTGSGVLRSSDFKLKMSASVETGNVGFYNYLADKKAGGKWFKDLHIGRVFNRRNIPIEDACFFESGAMGSSNGTIKPKIPTQWDMRDREGYSKADVYCVHMLNTGGNGSAKFRVHRYPFPKDLFKNFGSSRPFYALRGYDTYAYSENVTLKSEAGKITVYTETVDNTVDGLYAENRALNNNEISFILSDSNTIRFYDNPTLMTVTSEINITLNSSDLLLYMATWAKGSLYGINTQGVYKIDPSTGVATELSAASQSGENCFILASKDQTTIYCIVDGNVKVIDTADDSVASPANTVSETPTRDHIFSQVIIDTENNLWIDGRKYDQYTLALLLDLSVYPNETYYRHNTIHYFSHVRINTKYYGYVRIRMYTLDGEPAFNRLSTNTDSDYRRDRRYYKTILETYWVDKHYSSGIPQHSEWRIKIVSSADDLRTQAELLKGYRNWQIWDGTSWVKGWYADETPTGTIDGANKIFTCQNVPTALLPGKLKIVPDEGTEITDNGDGTLSDGGTVTYATGEITLAAAPSTTVTVYYELTSNAVAGTGIEIMDNVVLDFENGTQAPHFVKDDYFVFTVAEGHVVDNLESYSVSADVYIVPFHDEANETFTINATSMNVSKQSMTGFIKLDSDIGLTGTIAGTEATITTSQTPDAGAIGVDYNTGALYFNAADNGKQVIISYRWLERP